MKFSMISMKLDEVMMTVVSAVWIFYDQVGEQYFLG